MKKIFLLLFLTCGILFSFAEEKKEIPLQPYPETPQELRTPDFGNDIMAYYLDGVVYLQFAYDMGEVEITVTNESTGEQWQQVDDSAFGAASIATSTSAGNYYITIVTDDTTSFSGNFII